MSEQTSKSYFESKELWKPPVSEQLAVAADICALIPSDVVSILDAGCGNGAVTGLLKARWEVTAFDYSLAALQSVPPPRFKGNIAAIPLPDRCFDLVLATDVLEHLPQTVYERALSELVRVARKYILIAVPNQEILEHAMVHCPACGDRYHAHHHLRNYDPKTTLKLFEPLFPARVLQQSGDRWLFSNRDIIAARSAASGVDYPFEQAICARCDTRRGSIQRTSLDLDIARRFDCLQAMLINHGHESLPPASELIALYERNGQQHASVDLQDLTATVASGFCLSDLPVSVDPRPYPTTPVILEVSTTYALVALPRPPARIRVVQGTCSGVEVFDQRSERYVVCAELAPREFSVPSVASKQHGSFFRFISASSNDAFALSYSEPWSTEKIRSICFDFQDLHRQSDELKSLSDALSNRLQEEIDRSNELESRRANLENLLRAKDSLLSESGLALDELRKLSNQLALEHDSLEALLRIKDQALAQLDQRLTIAYQSASTAEISRDALEKHIKVMEAQSKVTNDAHRAVEAQLAATRLQLSALALASRKERPPECDHKVRSVLVVSHMYPRDYHPAGGIFVHEQVKALREKGIDARVLSGEPFWINTRNPLKILRAFRVWANTSEITWESVDGVPFGRFPYIVSRAFLPFELHFFSYCTGLNKIFKAAVADFEFDLVHAHTSYLDGFAASLLSKRLKKPLIITEHTGPFRTLTRNPWLRFWTTRAINRANKLLAVSSSLLNDIQNEVHLTNPQRASIVPNLVDTAFFKPSPPRGQKLIEMLWVGHFVSVKRIDRLLRAFQIAHQQNNCLRIKLVGDGVLMPDMKKLSQELAISELVHFAGHADREQLRVHYSACDFLVVSSDTETFGLVSIEALASGKPVLATDCGGPSDVIVDSRLGNIVARDEQSLAKGMVDMSGNLSRYDPDLLSEYVKLKFSAASIAATLVDVYQQTNAEYRQTN